MGGTDLPEEFLELIALNNAIRFETALLDRLLKEFGHLDPDSQQLSLLLVLHTTMIGAISGLGETDSPLRIALRRY